MNASTSLYCTTVTAICMSMCDISRAAPTDLDTSFNGTGIVKTTIEGRDHANGVALQSDGKIVVAGESSNSGGYSYKFAVARYHFGGSLDTSFGGTGKVSTPFTSNSQGNGVALQSDGKIVVAGSAFTQRTFFSDYDFALVRYLPDGSLDTSFGSGGKVVTDFGATNEDNGLCIRIQTDGRILVAGNAFDGSRRNFAMARYNTNGSLDTSFGSGGKVTASMGTGSSSANAMVLQVDGKIVLVGEAIGTNKDFAVARFNTNGSIDPNFAGGSGKVVTSIRNNDDIAYGVTVQADGKIVVAGYSGFVTVGGTDDFALIRLNSNGTLDNTFSSDGKLTSHLAYNDRARSVAVREDGRITVGGDSNGTGSHMLVARYLSDGSMDTTFGGTGFAAIPSGSYGAQMKSMAIQGNGRIVLAGYLGTAGEEIAVARLVGDLPVIEPEIVVSQPAGNALVDGVSSVNFGNVLAGTNTSLVFTIQNTGNIDLTGLGVAINGAGAGDYTLSSPPAAPVAPGGSTTFTVRFTPNGSGARNAALHIASNDMDENPFDIFLSGTGVAPEIGVQISGGMAVADGGSVSYGSVFVGASSSISFTVSNFGTANLILPAITIDGANSSEFAIAGNPASTLPPGGSTTFAVRFVPGAPGSSAATIHIQNNDANENPYDIEVVGTGVPLPYKAQIISPANGFVLTSTALQLIWNAGAGVTQYYLSVGTSSGGSQIYYGSQGTALSRTITVPATGGKVYVTLWSLIGGAWKSNVYVFTAQSPARAQLTGPANGSMLTDGNLNLNWTAGTGVSSYWIYVGSTVGGRDLHSVSAGTSTSRSFSVPQDGGPVYVTLYSLINGAWQSESYWFKTALPVAGSYPAALISPANTSTLGDTSVTFDWDAGVGVTRRDLWIGSSPDGYDLYKGASEAGFSRTATLPGDGRRIYVTLHSLLGGSWISIAYYFTAVTAPAQQGAQLVSPANGSTLASASLPLTWSAVTGATSYYLYVGNAPMGSDIYKASEGLNTSRTVTVPTDGRPVYLTIWTLLNGSWLQSTFWVTTQNNVAGNQKARITSPANGSVLPGATATFDWDTGTGVTNYSLYIGNTPGGRELYSATSSTILTRTLTTLPTDGRKIYATLWSQVGGSWQSNNYLYTAANITPAKAVMTSPTPGSTFDSTTVAFQWGPGIGATQYWLQAGTTPGSSNLFNSNQGTGLTRTLTNIPTDGGPIYVTLWSLIGGVWQTSESIYQAALPP